MTNPPNRSEIAAARLLQRLREKRGAEAPPWVKELATWTEGNGPSGVEDVTNAPPMPPATDEDLLESMRGHALEILLAPDLVDLVSDASDDLLARVRSLRRKIAMDMGLVVPPVRTRDSIELPPSTYVIRIAGVEAGRGIAPAGKVLALGEALDPLPGAVTLEPVFGLAGKWVPSEMRHSAEMTGATVIDRVSVVVTHLSSIIKKSAARLLSLEDVRVLTESVRESSPTAVDLLVPGLLSLAEVQRVLQGLLMEQVPINDLSRIYEALILRANLSNDPEGLVEAARIALGPMLTAPYLDGQTLRVIMIDPMLEQSMLAGLRPSELGTQIVMDQGSLTAVLNSIKEVVARLEATGSSGVLVCAPALRPAIRRMVSAQVEGLPVLSYQEVTSADVNIETVGVVRISDDGEERSENDSELMVQAAELLRQRRSASISLVERELHVGRNRASRLLGALEVLGVVRPADTAGDWDVLKTPEQLDLVLLSLRSAVRVR